LLTPASELNPTAEVRHKENQYHGLDIALDNTLIEKAQKAIDNSTPVVIEESITDINYTCRTMFSYQVSSKYGDDSLPDDTIQIKLKDHGGQSMAFTLAKGNFFKKIF